jgi:hypothetical protein
MVIHLSPPPLTGIIYIMLFFCLIDGQRNRRKNWKLNKKLEGGKEFFEKAQDKYEDLQELKRAAEDHMVSRQSD